MEEMRYNCTIAINATDEYGTYVKDSIDWSNCSEGELMSLIHLLRPGMTLRVEACHEEG